MELNHEMFSIKLYLLLISGTPNLIPKNDNFEAQGEKRIP